MYRKSALFLLVVAITGFFTACKDHYDDIQDLGQRVVNLEQSSQDFTQQYENLMKILTALQSKEHITKVTMDEDGNWVLEFSGTTGTITLWDGLTGPAGDDFNFNFLTVKDSLDGKTYWVYRDQWLTDADGNPIEVVVVTGEDAPDADIDPRTYTNVPVIVVDPITGTYKYTYNTQYDPSTGTWRPLTNAEWVDTGLSAKGDMGEQGETGEQGNPGVIYVVDPKTGERSAAPYMYTYLSEDGKYLIIVTPYGSYAIEIEAVTIL